MAAWVSSPKLNLQVWLEASDYTSSPSHRRHPQLFEGFPELRGCQELARCIEGNYPGHVAGLQLFCRQRQQAAISLNFVMRGLQLFRLGARRLHFMPSFPNKSCSRAARSSSPIGERALKYGQMTRPKTVKLTPPVTVPQSGLSPFNAGRVTQLMAAASCIGTE